MQCLGDLGLNVRSKCGVRIGELTAGDPVFAGPHDDSAGLTPKVDAVPSDQPEVTGVRPGREEERTAASWQGVDRGLDVPAVLGSDVHLIARRCNVRGVSRRLGIERVVGPPGLDVTTMLDDDVRDAVPGRCRVRPTNQARMLFADQAGEEGQDRGEQTDSNGARNCATQQCSELQYRSDFVTDLNGGRK